MPAAATLPAHLAVIVVLAVMALRMFSAAERKGRSGLRWMLLFFGLWLGSLALAAYGARWAFERHYHTPPRFWFIYAPAVVCAFAVVLVLHRILSKRRPLSAPETAGLARTGPRPTPALLPTPQPQPSPARLPTPPPQPAPPTEPAVFKFACPHCGQRLAVTTDDVGTAANCPNCEALLEVPAPPDTSVGGASA